MQVSKQSMLLYVVTDRTWLGQNTLEAQVAAILKAGATFIQLREKDLPFDEFVAQARKVKAITDGYPIPFIINDNIEVALAVDADGVHVGQHDMVADNVRQRIGPSKILGVSAQTVAQALAAQAAGADYIGVGSVFPTATKLDADSVSFDTLRAICAAVSVPVVAIGGINHQNVLQLKGSGIDGIAVISAIFAASDVARATRNLLPLAQEVTQ